jgi:hypothetical protein
MKYREKKRTDEEKETEGRMITTRNRKMFIALKICRQRPLVLLIKVCCKQGQT